MAKNSAIFCMYCDVAISKLRQEGLIRGDRDWDRHGTEYIIKLSDAQSGNDYADFVVVHDKNYSMITIHVDGSDEKVEYDFSEERRSKDEFASIMVEFAKRIKP